MPKIPPIYALLVTQSLSLVGSAMTRFGISIHVYQATGSVGAFSTLAICGSVPGLILMPVAGSLADRVSRRKALMLSDSIALLGTLLVLASALLGGLSLWQIALATILSSSAEAFQWPALAATIPQLARKDQLVRVNGMFETTQALGGIAAPALAGALYPLVGLPGLVGVDVVTCLTSVTTLALLALPPAAASAGATSVKEAFATLFRDAGFGFRWTWERKPLVVLVTFFTTLNFLYSMAMVVITPHLLGFLSEAELGLTQSLWSAGLAAGGALLAAWGGPKKRVNGVVYGWLASAALLVGLGFGRNVVVIGALQLLSGAVVPTINGSSTAIWQSVVPNDVQGRVFAARRMIAWGANPLGAALATPFATKVITPLAPEGWSPLGTTVAAVGVLCALVCLAGLARPDLRNLEARLAAPQSLS